MRGDKSRNSRSQYRGVERSLTLSSAQESANSSANCDVLRKQKISHWAPYLVVWLAFAVRGFRLATQSLWFDEILTAFRAELTLPALFAELMQVRNHVPLYFVAMRGWWLLLEGDGAFLLRFPSGLAGTLAVAVTYRLGGLVGGRWTGILAALLLSLAPLHVWHSQDARMYALATLLFVTAVYFLLRAWQEDRWPLWAGYAIFTALTCYTHILSLAMFVGLAIFCLLQIRRQPRRFWHWCAATGGAAVLFLPWLAVIAGAGGMKALFWIPRPRPVDLVLTLYVFTVGATAGWRNALTYLPLVISLGVLAVLRWRRERLSSWRRWALGVLAGDIVFTLLFIFLIAQLRPVYVTRYFLPLLPLWLVLVACGLQRLAPRRAGVLLVLLLAFDLLSLYNMYFVPRYQREDWRSVAGYIETHARPGDALASYNIIPFRYYRPDGLEAQEVLAYETVAQFARRMADITAGHRRLWLVIPLPGLEAHGFAEARKVTARRWVDRNPQKLWLDERYRLVDEQRFPAMCLLLYELEK